MILEAASVGLKNILVREKKPRIWVNHLGKNWEALSPDPCVETLVMDADVLNALFKDDDSAILLAVSTVSSKCPAPLVWRFTATCSQGGRNENRHADGRFFRT